MILGNLIYNEFISIDFLFTKIFDFKIKNKSIINENEEFKNLIGKNDKY